MDDTAELDITPLHSLHLSLGARMVPFAGKMGELFKVIAVSSPALHLLPFRAVD